jgi:hypothetical protein
VDRWFFKRFEGTKIGELFLRIRYRFVDVLKQCHEAMESFEGSEETLRHIQRVEVSLKRLIVEAN